MTAPMTPEAARLLHEALAAMSRGDFSLMLPPASELSSPGVLVADMRPVLMIGGVSAHVLAHMLVARMAELEAACSEADRLRGALRALANTAAKAAE